MGSKPKKKIAVNSYRVGFNRGKLSGLLSKIPPRKFEVADGVIDYWFKTKKLKSLHFDGIRLEIELND